MELNIEADQIASSFHPIAQQTTDINDGIALMELIETCNGIAFMEPSFHPIAATAAPVQFHRRPERKCKRGKKFGKSFPK